MGINNSSDSFCAKSDQIFAGVPGLIKIVDDGLILGETISEVITKFEIALKACKKHNLTLAEKKLEYGSQVNFGGYIISELGVLPDPKKVEALKNFPRPKDITTLRSFLGLANQLAFFVPDFAHTSGPLRELLKKEVPFQWQQSQENAFEAAKGILTSKLVVKPFHTNYATELLCDASRLYGLGYVLLQRDPNDPELKPRLIQCGSRSLIPAETRYATNEIEAQAMQWAIDDCKHYLLGCNFKVITDHRPLVGTFKKPLTEITNSRLLRTREKLTNYNFEVIWAPGKNNAAADTLSRIPQFATAEKGQCCCVNMLGQHDADDCKRFEENIYKTDPLLKDILQAAQSDEEYQTIMSALKTRKRHSDLPATHPARKYKSLWQDLSVDSGLIILSGTRIVVPAEYRPKILEHLHMSHAGIQRTRTFAQRHYYWPGINNAIKQVIELCDKCQSLRPSKPQEKLQPYLTCSEPMHGLSTDLFEDKGHHYLIICDRYSGYPFAFPLKTNQLTTQAIIARFEKIFKSYGKPINITADNGPQFRQDFEDWCKANSITLIHSSPYNHKSNSVAEATVKNCEYLLRKCNYNDEYFQKCLMYYRNTPAAHSTVSPAEKFFGRIIRTEMPIWHKKAITLVPPTTEKQPFHVGQKVRIQNPVTKRWDETATIEKILDSKRSYALTRPHKSQQIIRNRQFMKPLSRSEARGDSTIETPISASIVGNGSKQPLRTSKRLRR